MPRTIMTYRRTAAAAMVVLVVVAGLLRLLDNAASQPAGVQSMAPGTAFAVPVSRGRAVLDLPSGGGLPAGKGQRYLLLVNSLEEAEVIQRVRLRAMAAPSGGNSVRLQAVRPLQLPPAPVREAPHRAQETPHGARSRFSVPAGRTNRAIKPPPQRRSFRLHVTDGDPGDPRQYTNVPGQLVGHGDRVQVFLDRQLRPADLSTGLVEEIVDRFDNEVVPRVCGLLGSWNDVDGDHRFTVLLSPWLGKLQGGRTSVGGFVRQADFSRTTAMPPGNGCDMMYLNSSLKPGRHLQTLLLHEFTHAVCFSQRGAGSVSGPQLPREEDWLNEAIAHSVETRFGGWTNLDYRISRYLNDTTRYPLVVPDYYSAGLWRSHGCRGATWLFLHWLEARFGPSILPQIVREPAGGIVGLERVVGLRFPALYRHFTLALAGVDAEISPLPVASVERAASGQAGSSLRAFPRLPATIGQWVMAGPRPRVWRPAGQRELTLELTGTGTAQIVIETTAAERSPVEGAAAELTTKSGEESATTPPAWRIEVQGSTSRLQVTVVALNTPPQELKLRAVATTGPRQSAAINAAMAQAATPAGRSHSTAAGHVVTAEREPAGAVVRADYTRLNDVPPQPAAGESVYGSATRARTTTSRISPGAAEILVCIEAGSCDQQQTATSSGPCEVLLLSCELHDGDTRRSVCLRGETLELARFHHQSSATADHRLWFRIPFPPPDRRRQSSRAANKPDPVVKAIVRDSAGRQRVLWGTARDPGARGPVVRTPAVHTVAGSGSRH